MSAGGLPAPGVAAMLPQWWPLLLGNVLEWYEFGVYGYLAEEMGSNFFNGSEMATWIGFAITFLLRPIGGLVLGRLADRFGRKLAVVVSMAGMLIATAGQGCLPTRSCCGEGAGRFGTALLFVFRAMQGLSAGGEVGCIATYFAETAPRGSLARGLASTVVCGMGGFVLASGVVELTLLTLGPDRMMLWAWRLPFLISLPPALVSLWGRRRLGESTEFLEMAEQAQHTSEPEGTQRPRPAQSNPPGDATADGSGAKDAGKGQLARAFWRDHGLTAAVGFGCSCAGANALYFGIWAAHRAVQGGLTESQGLLVSMLTMATLSGTIAAWAYVYDTYGASDPLVGLILGCTGLAVGSGPAFAALAAWPGNMLVAVVFLSGFFGVVSGLALGPLYLLITEIFPTEIRVLGFGLTFNLAYSYVGGTAALVAQALDSYSPVAPGLYAAGVGALSAAVAVLARCLRARGKLPSHLTSAKAPAEAGHGANSVRSAVVCAGAV